MRTRCRSSFPDFRIGRILNPNISARHGVDKAITVLVLLGQQVVRSMIGSLLPRRLPSLLSALAAPVSARQAHRDSRHLVIEVAGREFDPVRFVHDHSWTEANQTDCAVLALLKHLSFDKGAQFAVTHRAAAVVRHSVCKAGSLCQWLFHKGCRLV